MKRQRMGKLRVNTLLNVLCQKISIYPPQREDARQSGWFGETWWGGIVGLGGGCCTFGGGMDIFRSYTPEI